MVFCMNFGRLVGNIGATSVLGESAASNFRVGVESMFHIPDFTYFATDHFVSRF